MGKSRKQDEIELEPDAWRRFERAVDVVAKSPPQHRTKTSNRGKTRRKGATKRAKGQEEE